MESISNAGHSSLDLQFDNTEIAFAFKSDQELKKAAWLFGLMNKHWLVGIGSKVGIAAIKMHLPFVESIVKHTIFEQFCGGTTLAECSKTIEKLYRHQVLTILDYGAEGKEKEEDFNRTMNETIRAVEFAAEHASVPVVSSKVSGLARNGLLEAAQQDQPLSAEEQTEWERVRNRMDAICRVAAEKGVSVYFDAEETWVQTSISRLVKEMMQLYNRQKPIVYDTYQLYRTDHLDYLKSSYEEARRGGYILGAKLVRGAYMDKERERAEEMGYPSPIHPNKAATDQAYNDAVRFCVDHYDTMGSSNASHNAESNRLQAELIVERGIPRNHPNLNFCQLYGMSDNLTFNLAESGFNVAKYVPYGPVKEVVPYLIRRAQENSSVTGDMSREHRLVVQEMKRRGLA